MQFALWKFLGLVVAVGAAIGLYARTTERYKTDGGGLYRTSNGSLYDQVRIYEDGRMVCWLVFPASTRIGCAIFAGPPSSNEGVHISRRHGLYLNGQPFKMTAPVYVATQEKTLRPVRLTATEMEQLERDTPVWVRKIEPLIDQEYQRGLGD